MIGTVEHLITYPLTGGPGVEHNSAELGVHAGFTGDRVWVPYDNVIGPFTERNRVSLKGPKGKLYAKLAQLVIKTDEQGLTMSDPNYPNEAVNVAYTKSPGDCNINEFDMITPGVDAGDKASDFLAEYLKHPTVRLAQKTHNWLVGNDGPVFEDRIVAPLHVIADSSVELLRDKITDPEYSYGRFRPNIVISGDFEPDSEFTWQSMRRLGTSSRVDFIRETVRCVVTGITQSGQNAKDVLPLLLGSKRMVNGTLQPVKGVYATYMNTVGSAERLHVEEKVVIKQNTI